MIRVLIVAASPLARAGLANLAAYRGVQIVGSFASIDAVAPELDDALPDVVLIDSGGQFESTLEELAASGLLAEISVILLAENPPSAWPSQALRSGVRAVLPNDVSPPQLAAALQAVAAGLVVLHPAEIDSAAPAPMPASSAVAGLTEPLTRREREVLQMLAGGLGNKQIAARLTISEHTAKFHVASVLGKLGAGTRTEAVAIGIRRGLVLL